MADTVQWKERWEKNYTNGYASKLGNSRAIDIPMHWYFSKYLFPKWREVTKNDTVLELGCGNGAVAMRVFNKVKKLVGTDISENAIQMIRERFEGYQNVRFEVTTDLLSLGEKFDMIYCITVFQHLPKDFTIQYINDCKKVLKKGGALFFNVLSGIQDHNEADINFEENGVCEPSMGFSKEEIHGVCKKAGFKNIEIIKMECDTPTHLFWWYWVICIKDKK